MPAQRAVLEHAREDARVVLVAPEHALRPVLADVLDHVCRLVQVRVRLDAVLTAQLVALVPALVVPVRVHILVLKHESGAYFSRNVRIY